MKVTTMRDMAKGKAATPGQSDRVRDLVRQVRDERFNGSAAETARALGISPPALSDLLSGKRGPGLQTLEGLRNLTGMSLDHIMYGDGLTFRAGALGGWADAVRAAQKADPAIPIWAWEIASELSVPTPGPATPELASDLACVAWRHVPNAVRGRLDVEQDRIKREAASAMARSEPSPPRGAAAERLGRVWRELKRGVVYAAQTGDSVRALVPVTDAILEVIQGQREPLDTLQNVAARAGRDIGEVAQLVEQLIADERLWAYESERTFDVVGAGPKVLVHRRKPFYGDEDPATLTRYYLNRAAAAVVLEYLGREDLAPRPSQSSEAKAPDETQS